MKVTSEKTGTCEYTLRLDVEPERLQAPLHQAAQRLGKRRPLPGFRPGKAPYAMVERVFGKELIYDEMLDKFGPDLYQEALKESGLDPYAQAHLEIVQMEPLQLKFTVPVQPVVTLGDYHKIHVKPKAVKVRKTEVEETLQRIRESVAVWAPVERAIKFGDQAVVAAVGMAAGEVATEEKELTLEVREDMTPPEFAQGLLGVGPGQSKEFDVTYPAEYSDKSLAGKQIHFTVTVKSVKEKELPPLDDELAKSVGSFESLAKLREQIDENLRREKEADSKDEALSKALDTLVERSTIEYPSVAVEHETEEMVQGFADRLAQRGFTLQGYLDMNHKTAAQFYDETKESAEKRLKRTLALVKFAEAEGVQVDPGEVDQEVDRLSQPYGDRAEEIKKAFRQSRPLTSIANDVYRRKALDRLLAIATGAADAKPEPPAPDKDDEPEQNA